MRILDNDYYKELSEDLTDEALAWVESSGPDLIRAPHPPPGRLPPVHSTDSIDGGEPLDGGPVVLDED